MQIVVFVPLNVLLVRFVLMDNANFPANKVLQNALVFASTSNQTFSTAVNAKCLANQAKFAPAVNASFLVKAV